MHPEIFQTEQVKQGIVLRWYDLLRFFDCNEDACNRTRFLSYLFGHFNVLFRFEYARWFAPHPSLSLTWPLSVLSVYFFYRGVTNLTNDRMIGLVVSALYVLSAGFLSGLLMLFHTAKPLALFFLTLALWAATELERSGDARPQSKWALTLYAALLLGFVSDEMAWFMYAAIPLLLPSLFLTRRRLLFAACYAATFPLFLLFTAVVAPVVIHRLFPHYSYEAWRWAFNVGRAELPDQLSFFERFEWSALGRTAYALIASQYAWLQSGPSIAYLSVIAVVGLGLAAAIMGDRRNRWLLLRSSLVLALFCIFAALVSLRQSSEVGFSLSGSFYYGNLFAPLSLMVVAVAMACCREAVVARVLAYIVAVYLAVVAFTWTRDFNVHWIAIHDKIYADVFGTSRNAWLAIEMQRARRIGSGNQE